MHLAGIHASEEPLGCSIRKLEKEENWGPDILTTATGSFIFGSMTAGLITSRVKPETHQSSTRSKEDGRMLTIFRIVVGCVYSSRITDCWRQKTLGGGDFRVKLGARWSGLCSVNHARVWTIRFWVTEPEVADAIRKWDKEQHTHVWQEHAHGGFANGMPKKPSTFP